MGSSAPESSECEAGAMPKNPSETGRQCTVAKVRNWIGEGTFAGARSNDEDAPKAAIQTAASKPRGSTEAV